MAFCAKLLTFGLSPFINRFQLLTFFLSADKIVYVVPLDDILISRYQIGNAI